MVVTVVVARVAVVVKAIAFQGASFLLNVIGKISVLPKQYYSAAGPMERICATPFYPQPETAAPDPTASPVELVYLVKVSQNTLYAWGVVAFSQLPDAS